jgi:hypothetical protein
MPAIAVYDDAAMNRRDARLRRSEPLDAKVATAHAIHHIPLIAAAWSIRGPGRAVNVARASRYGGARLVACAAHTPLHETHSRT